MWIGFVVLCSMLIEQEPRGESEYIVRPLEIIEAEEEECRGVTTQTFETFEECTRLVESRDIFFFAGLAEWSMLPGGVQLGIQGAVCVPYKN